MRVVVLCAVLALLLAAGPAHAAVESVAPVRADELRGGQLFMDAAGVTHLAMVLNGPATRSGSTVRQRRCIVYANDRGGAFSHDTVGCYTERGTGSLPAAAAPAIAVRFGRPFVAWVRTGAGGVAISKRDRDGGEWRTDTVRRISRVEHDAGLQVNVEGNRARVSWSRCQAGNPPVCRIAYAVRNEGARFRVLTLDVDAGVGTQLALGRLPYVLYRMAGRLDRPRELRLSRITRSGGRAVTVSRNAVHGADLVSAPEGIVVAYQQGRGANPRVRLVAGPAHGPFRQMGARVPSGGGPLGLARSAVPGGPVRFVVAHLARRATGSPATGTRPVLSALADGRWTFRLVQQQGVDDFRPLGLGTADAPNRMALSGSCSTPTAGGRSSAVCVGRGDAGF